MESRIYHEGPLLADTEITLQGNPARHIGKVLRLRVGDNLILFNNSGMDYPATIVSLERAKIIVRVQAGSDPGTESALHITLFQGVCKNHRMDALIQKSTELGVNFIQPVLCERSVVKLDPERRKKKTAHWQQVAISACEQSRRARIPKVAEPINIDALATALAGNNSTRLLLDPRADATLGQTLAQTTAVTLLIGPEGGLSEWEHSTAIAAKFQPVKLGPRILRTETAPLAALSIIQYLVGDLG